jgi:hypothetical protein
MRYCQKLIMQSSYDPEVLREKLIMAIQEVTMLEGGKWKISQISSSCSNPAIQEDTTIFFTSIVLEKL